MVKRFILGLLIIFSFVISGCNSKTTTVEVTPTTEVIEEVVETPIGE